MLFLLVQHKLPESTHQLPNRLAALILGEQVNFPQLPVQIPTSSTLGHDGSIPPVTELVRNFLQAPAPYTHVLYVIIYLLRNNIHELDYHLSEGLSKRETMAILMQQDRTKAGA